MRDYLELFYEDMNLKKKEEEIVSEFYKKVEKVRGERKRINDEITSRRLKELGIEIGDKVIDTGNNNCAYLVGFYFTQKMCSYHKEHDEIGLGDYAFRAAFKRVLKDGSMGKKEEMGYLRVDNLKKYKEG